MFDVTPASALTAYGCGAACLQMLLGYYGADTDAEALYRECGVTERGCSAKALLQAGRAHGLDMTAWRMDAEELLKQDRPAIIWWGRCHWVLFCGTATDGLVCLCDPDNPLMQVVPADEFNELYSGVALFNGEPHDLEPDAE